MIFTFWYAIGLVQFLSVVVVFLTALAALICRGQQLNLALSIACRVFAGISLLLSYSYVMELFVSYYSANKFEGDALTLRFLSGPYVWVYWSILLFNVLLSQLLWSKHLHVRPVWPLVISGGYLLLLVVTGLGR